MKHILTIKLSKRTKLLYFQNFISVTFLDNLLLEKNLEDSLYFYAPLDTTVLLSYDDNYDENYDEKYDDSFDENNDKNYDEN